MLQSSPHVQRVGFSATTTSAGSRLQLRLEGIADTDMVGDLAAYLRAVHESAIAQGIEEVSVDLRSLFFMTSSCFKCLITWITSIEELEEPKRYKIRLEENANLHWQRRSLDALRNFAPSVVFLHH
jgi:hypothetical protein